MQISLEIFNRWKDYSQMIEYFSTKKDNSTRTIYMGATCCFSSLSSFVFSS